MDGSTISNGQFVSNDSLGGSPVISSGQEDIILTPTASDKKGGKKWLAVVVVVLFVVAVVTGVAAIITVNRDNSSKKVSSDEVQAKFNQLLNYFVSNKDSNADMSVDELTAIEPYALATFNNNDVEYFKTLRERVSEFGDMYLSEDSDSSYVERLLYYCDLGMVERVTDEEIMNIYIASGRDAVVKRLNGLMAAQSASGDVVEYIAAQEDMMDITLALLDMLNDAGCIQDDAINSTCGSTVQGYQSYLDEYAENYSTVNLIVTRMQSEALNALSGLYTEVYNVNSEMTVE